MQLAKYHGLGNDYFVLESGEALGPERVKAICDRHTGMGSDGILEPFETERADYGVTIWNPDGSVAEKSGNGLRIFARWLVDSRQAPRSFSVWTGACLVSCVVKDETIVIEMGEYTTNPSSLPLDTVHPLVNGRLVGSDVEWTVTALSVGNPHCVQFHERALDELPWRAWGEEIEVHPLFPNRVNVQFAKVIDPSTLEIRIWERGAGETHASGSSSCAAAAAAVLTGRMPAGRITVLMPGGELFVTVRSDQSLLLEGPVERIGVCRVAPEWLGRRC